MATAIQEIVAIINAEQAKEWTYFIQAGYDGPIKIGRAGNPIRRLNELQTGSYLNLLLIAQVKGNVEKQLHSLFKEHHLRGEWFVDHVDIAKFIYEHATHVFTGSLGYPFKQQREPKGSQPSSLPVESDYQPPCAPIKAIERNTIYTAQQLAGYFCVSIAEIIHKYLIPQIWKNKSPFRGCYIVCGTSVYEWLEGDHE